MTADLFPSQHGPGSNLLISVIIPVYNAAPMLEEAIRSIRAQTWQDWELLIVDDGSTDDSAAVAGGCAASDSRIRVLTIPHSGRSAAANAGTAAAGGDLIARLDADDVALPDRFAVQAAWMQEHDLDVCGSWVQTFGSQERLLWFPETPEAVRAELYFRCAVLQPTVMLKTAVAKANPYDEKFAFEDYELWTRIAPHYRIGNVPRVLGRYRSHPGQSTRIESSAFRSEAALLRRRYLETMLPEKHPAEREILARIPEEQPFESLADLRVAGQWLSTLARIDDAMLRERLADRWLAACSRSAHLGPACFKAWREAGPIGRSGKKNLRLWVKTALRMRKESPLSPAAATARRLQAGFISTAAGRPREGS